MIAPRLIALAATPDEASWKRSRYAFALFCFFSFLAGWLVLRAGLLVAFKPPALGMGDLGRVFLSGFHRDLCAGVMLTVPLLFWLLLMPQKWVAARWHRFLFWSACLLFWFVVIFLFFAELFFFEEFRSRFNTVAVDYLLYPHEVFVNIWESYHVGIVVLLCLVLSLGWLWLARRLFARMWERPFSFGARLVRLAVGSGLAVLLGLTLNLKTPRVSGDRMLNEIANNGAISFVAAFWTRHLDYAAFYQTMPSAEAYQRVRALLAEPGAQFVADNRSIRWRIAGDESKPRLNVVLILEESLGSEFWGCLGRAEPTLTPEMDRLAATEGLLFTNIYACGNRTVRGMEGALSSFPPLPGDSIVKRDLSDNVETIARVLKRDGYATLFLYGGRGLFDGMRSYAVRNGYDRFIEQRHFEKPTFATIWGVCDEDLFQRTIEECRDLAKAGPFLATVLSVSNHKPYTYPKGRIPEDPDEQRRENAVKYSDYALGLFFERARKEAFWSNTVFVVVADHGARVYGEQSIPIKSYEIPLVIAGPAVVTAPARLGQLGGSLDVAPTVLGMIGRPYDSLFFGRDLLKTRPQDGRALLNHNRDIGLLARDRLVVLGLMQTEEFYQGDPKGEVKLLAQPTEADRELQKDAMALYQVADDLYVNRRFAIDAAPGSQSGAAQGVAGGP